MEIMVFLILKTSCESSDNNSHEFILKNDFILNKILKFFKNYKYESILLNDLIFKTYFNENQEKIVKNIFESIPVNKNIKKLKIEINNNYTNPDIIKMFENFCYYNRLTIGNI
jgi:hypothetical protein